LPGQAGFRISCEAKKVNPKKILKQIQDDLESSYDIVLSIILQEARNLNIFLTTNIIFILVVK